MLLHDGRQTFDRLFWGGGRADVHLDGSPGVPRHDPFGLETGFAGVYGVHFVAPCSAVVFINTFDDEGLLNGSPDPDVYGVKIFGDFLWVIHMLKSADEVASLLNVRGGNEPRRPVDMRKGIKKKGYS